MWTKIVFINLSKFLIISVVSILGKKIALNPKKQIFNKKEIEKTFSRFSNKLKSLVKNIPVEIIDMEKSINKGMRK